MQYDGIQPQIHYPSEHLPDWFEQADPLEIPAALWNQNNNDPEQLAGDDAVGPDCLDQLDKQLPIIPSDGFSGVLGFSSSWIPESHPLTSLARILDAPAAWPLDNWATADRILPSSGGLLSIPMGSTSIGRGSPSTHSDIWRSIVRPIAGLSMCVGCHAIQPFQVVK